MKQRSDETRKGALFLIIGEALLVLMAAMFKEIDTELNFFVKVFFRNVFGFISIVLFLLLTNTLSLKTKVLKWHFFRTAVGLCGMYGFFYVIANMKLAEASMVKLTAPFFLPIIAYFWLREKIYINHIIALIIGFVGVSVLLQPGTGSFQPIAIIGLVAAAFQSMAKVTIRKMSISEPFGRVIFFFGLFGSIITAIPAIFYWETPKNNIWLILILLGFFGTSGQIFITKAYQIASPGKIGAYTYTSLVTSSLLGYFFWLEKLSWYIILGSALIITAGLINLYNKK